MAGFDAPYVPGWDCHGLPIELKVDRQLGPKKRQMCTADFRRACRAYAAKYVDILRRDFKRLGVFGTWDDPYLTMAFRYQAAIVRALGRFVEQDMVYKGKKPVHWCMHCRTALAEAEVEYEPHTSPSIYVEFPLSEASAAELATRLPALAGTTVSVLIWTTTPWTIPSNLAIAFHPEFGYGAYEVGGTVVIVAKDLAEAVAAKTGRSLRRAARDVRRPCDGAARVPASALRARLAGRARRLRDARSRHRRRAHGARPRRGRLPHRRQVRTRDLRRRSMPAATSSRRVELFAGLQVLDANPKIEAALAERGRLWHREDYDHSYPHCWRCHNPVIFLATSQWFIAMDAHDLRARALEAIDGRVDPVVGPRPHLQHDRQPARLVHLAPARLGCADPGARLHDVRHSRS